jgi:hypothetical protein
MRKRLYECFKTMRNHAEWKRLVKGGAFFFQSHVSKNDGTWHAHAHLLIESLYFPQAEISRLWKEVTGDSDNVHIAPIDDVGDAVREATRYAASPIDKESSTDIAAIAESIDALNGAHLCFTFGTWRGTKLSEQAPEDPNEEWEDLGSLGSIIRRAQLGEVAAKSIIDTLLYGSIDKTGPPKLFEPRLYTVNVELEATC